MPKPSHLAGLRRTKAELSTADGHTIEVWRFTAPQDSDTLSQWATSFRKHYCSDEEIDPLRDGTGLDRSRFLVDLIFPDEHYGFGPSIRAGDFTELLLADYLEYELGYWVPRDKYSDKASRNESVKGIDVLGFRLEKNGVSSPDDVLLSIETKAQLSGRSYKGKLQEAIDGSSRDFFRRGVTLHAIKRRMHREGRADRVAIVSRFQDIVESPYVSASGAAALLEDGLFDSALIEQTTVGDHGDTGNLTVMVIRGKDLMALVNALYQRAADEA